MALSANRELSRYVDQQLRSFKAADEHIYKGALLSIEAGGYVAPLTAGELFAGVAYEECDNSGGSDGDLSLRAYTVGDFEHALSGATIANVGDAVYASDDGTLTFTSTSNTFVGYCVDVPSSGVVIVRIQPFATVSA
ncbi:MAG: hypothetical protein PVI86_08045 [Phycisphaerae bacterium]|jgi:hypothetical protein